MCKFQHGIVRTHPIPILQKGYYVMPGWFTWFVRKGLSEIRSFPVSFLYFEHPTPTEPRFHLVHASTPHFVHTLLISVFYAQQGSPDDPSRPCSRENLQVGWWLVNWRSLTSDKKIGAEYGYTPSS
jgi:hypothetical protein